MYNKMIIKTKDGVERILEGCFNVDVVGGKLLVYDVQSFEMIAWARIQIRQARPSEIDYIEVQREDLSARAFRNYSFVSRVDNNFFYIT